MIEPNARTDGLESTDTDTTATATAAAVSPDAWVPIADPVDPQQLAVAIDRSQVLTSFRGLDVIVFEGSTQPLLLHEVGRIRETEFRAVGAGRNLPLDLDHRDQGPGSYRHLVVWDPNAHQLVGAYRYLYGADLPAGDGGRSLRTNSLFAFSQDFADHYLPYTVELGRSVVNRQAKRAFMGLFALWAGLAALVAEIPRLRYFFGNISLYRALGPQLTGAIIAYLEQHHRSGNAGRPGLVQPRAAVHGLPPQHEPIEFGDLEQLARGLDQSLPPILVSYLSACPGLSYLGTARDADFGNSLEAAILVPVDALSAKTVERFRKPSTDRANRAALVRLHPSLQDAAAPDLFDATFALARQYMARGAAGAPLAATSVTALETAGLHSLPPAALPPGELLDRLAALMEHSPDSSNPRFLNQLFGPRLEPAIAASVLALVANNSMYTFKAAGAQILVEQAVTAKMLAAAGFPAGEGMFTPGGSLANLSAMVLARQQHFAAVRDTGRLDLQPTVYSSAEAHYSISKNAGILGLGRAAVRTVPVDSRGGMDPDALLAMIAADRAAGFSPWLVNATAGTTVRGAFDPIDRLAAICAQERLWLHVDGALGASVLLSARHRHVMAGVEAADSLAWNAHKMMGLPLQTSVLLTRHRGLIAEALDERADYLYQSAEDQYNPGHRSIQCGRRNDALGLWAAWAALGDEGWAERVDRQMAAAQLAAEVIAQDPDFELIETPQSVNVCFVAKAADSQTLCDRLDATGSLKIGHGQVGDRRAIRLVCIDPTLDRARIDWILNEIRRHV